MTDANYTILHLEDDPGDVSYIPRTIRQRLIPCVPNGSVALAEDDREQDFTITSSAPGFGFELRYLIAETVDEFTGHFTKYKASGLFILDVVLETDKAVARGLDVYKQLRDQGIPQERILIFTAWPQRVQEQLDPQGRGYKLVMKAPNREELIRVVFTMMCQFWPRFAELGLVRS